MPDSNTQTKTGLYGLPPFPQVLEGDALYDALMSQIEPDLMKAVYPTVDEKYKGEIPEQHSARMKRYAKAVEEYKKRFDQYESEWDAHMRAFESGVVATVEEADREEEGNNLQSLENTFNSP